MLSKQSVIETIKNLPEEFSIDQLLDKLILIQKIEIGLEQSKKGQTTSDDKLDEKLGKWRD